MKIMKLASEMRDSFVAIIRANTAATVSEANDASLKIINTLIAETKTTADEIERLRAALLEAAYELDAYYRAEYPGDHPYSRKKLAEAMASNPARAALGGSDD